VRIEDWMKFPVHSAKPVDSIARARAVLEQYRVNQLPVVLNNRLVGIVTDRDLRSASPAVAEAAAIDAGTMENVLLDPEKTPIEQVMTAQVITLGPKDTIEQATRLLISERIGAIPVVEQGRLVGILTRSDVLGAFLGVIASGRGVSQSAKPAQRSKSTQPNLKPAPKKSDKPATKKARRMKPKRRAKR